MNNEFNYQGLLSLRRREPMSFSQFVESFLENPEDVLRTSSGIILEAIRHFGIEIIIRSGEPVLHYKVFSDPFSKGINAVHGQEFCIKRILDVIESVDRESGPRRGIVMVGPPASGKTNIVDLIAQALEEYTKKMPHKLYTFTWLLKHNHDQNSPERELELNSALALNPILLFPTSLSLNDGTVVHPRQELFEEARRRHPDKQLNIPSYYQYATLDKRSLDILSALRHNIKNKNLSLADILDKYVTVEELIYSNAQGRGIANVDDMAQLQTFVRTFTLSPEDVSLLNDHLQGKFMFKYEGPLLSSNRGLLHIHDAFGPQGSNGPSETDYKPLLMLLGSGKVTLEATQASIDNCTIMTTNLDEMDALEKQLTSSKLLDRIEKIPVNYLLDAHSEMCILQRDLSNIMQKFDVDPNLLRIASAYSVITRLFAPARTDFPNSWEANKIELYKTIAPEQKLAIYSCQPESPLETIRKLPPWHPFRNECFRLGINIHSDEQMIKMIRPTNMQLHLEETQLFSEAQLALIDDEFMRLMREEHYPEEGKFGISVRQLQNIMRNTITSSDGIKVTVRLFLKQLEKIFSEGPSVHHWLAFKVSRRKSRKTDARIIGHIEFGEGDSNFENYSGLIKVVKAIYFTWIRKEITISTVNRNPDQIEMDLRKYLQHALLANAIENKAFSHLLIPRYTYIDPSNGKKVDSPDYDFMISIEKILKPEIAPLDCRHEISARFLKAMDQQTIKIQLDQPLINSRDDMVNEVFAAEFNTLLSHHRSIEGIDPDTISDAFFHRISDYDRFLHYSEDIQTYVNTVLSNMSQRFHYSEEIALDTITYALREEIINISDMIN